MILPTDIPTRAQLERLLAARDPSSVSIYQPTNPSSRGDAERIELRNLASEASTQLDQAGGARADVAAIDDELADLVDDDEFWRYQARSLALFVTPTTTTTFRLPNNLATIVEVSDRFHLKPLLRAVTFPHTRASADIADVARAATHGLVDTVLVDIDEVVPGRVEEETGAVTFDDTGDAANYGVVDEIARRVWLNGGKVLAVRRDDIPGNGSVAAILRYAP